MAIKALEFIHSVARKLLAKQSGEGITSIGNKIQAEAKAGEIAETFRLSGIPLEKLDDFIKSEKDVLKYLNIIESSKPVTKEVSKDLIKVPRKKGEVVDLTGKKIDTSKPIIGGKNVPETEKGFIPMKAEQYRDLFGKSPGVKEVKKTDAQIKAKIDAMNKKTVANIKARNLFATEKEFASELESLRLNIIRNDPQFNLEIAESYKLPGEKTYTAFPDKEPGKLLSPTQRQKLLDQIKDVMKHDQYQTQFGEYFDFTEITDDLFRIDKAYGGLAGMLGEPTYADEDHRVPYKDGTKFNPKRRTILKGLGALAALPVVGKFFKFVKPLAKTSKVADLTSVPIGSAEGMPAWFKPLVNKVIREGESADSWATGVKSVVHKTKLPNSKTTVVVEQQLDTGDVIVDIGVGKHGFADGHLGQPVRLEYKAKELIEPDLKTGKGGGKTNEEFWVEEAEFTGGHPDNIKFEESTIEKFGDHGSNFDEVEAFATGKVKKSKPTKKAERTEYESGKAEADAERVTDEAREDVDFDDLSSDDFAEGGRVPMWLGGAFTKGKRTLSDLLKYMSKGSSHGQTPSEMLYMINPKQFNKMLDKPEGIPSIAKEMIEKYIKEMKIDRSKMVEDLIGTGRKMKKVDDDIMNYKIKIIEDMVSKGTDRATAEQMAETILMMVKQRAKKRPTPKITDQGLLEMENIQKNLTTKDRKLNATGGRVSLSGGGLAGMLGE